MPRLRRDAAAEQKAGKTRIPVPKVRLEDENQNLVLTVFCVFLLIADNEAAGRF